MAVGDDPRVSDRGAVWPGEPDNPHDGAESEAREIPVRIARTCRTVRGLSATILRGDRAPLQRTKEAQMAYPLLHRVAPRRGEKLPWIGGLGLALVVAVLAGCSSGTSTAGTSSTTSASTTSTTVASTTSTTSTTVAGGNGVASESPSQILSSAGQAMKSAHSVQLTVTATENGEPITIDFTSFSDGNLDGTASLDGNPAKVIITGGTLYINADAAYWIASSASKASADEWANKWVSGPDTGYGLSTLASEFGSSTQTVTAGTTGTVDGQPALSILFSTGPMWVATTGPAYAIKIDSTSATLTFSDWNEGTHPTVPAGAKLASSF
jgi:hypothetical protein